jgi:predicted O-linked N-acetylglucosamine transferase (SPINDLY family)
MHFVVDQLLATAQAHAQEGRFREAAAACEQVLKTQPANARALFLLGYLLHQTGQWQPALQRLTQSVAVNPTMPEPYFLIGLIHQQQRNLPAAIAAYQQVIRLQPKHPKALNNLGRAMLDVGQVPEGIAMLRRAVDADPRNAGAFNNLGDGLRISGDYDSAVTAQRQAIAIDPKSAEAHSNLGSALAKQQKIAEAMTNMRRAMELNPKLATPRYNLARVLQDQGRLDEAIEQCQTAVNLRPAYPEALNLLGNLSGITADVPRAIALQRQSVEAKPDNPGTHSNLLLSLHYIDELSPAQLYQAHLKWAAQHAKAVAAGARAPRALAGERLRIGYVSPNFMNHSVAYFIEPVLAAHDHTRFEIFCYVDLSKSDAMTARLKGYPDHWRETTGQSDAIVAELIQKDRIDILVDLAGHTSENRMKLFALRPAPIQITWLGYPDTTGLTQMDYRITDSIADPPGPADQLHTEKLIRIEGGCWAYRPPADAPAVMPTPALVNGNITFGSFNNLPKVTPTVLKTWASILQSVPNSRLILKALALHSQAAMANVMRPLTEAGIAANRIEALAWTPATTSHLELYSRIDIALDTFPYNGTTTTCEAVWMGVPVISFPGNTHVSRVGASLLTHAGLPGLLAVDREDYIKRAVTMAGDIEQLQNLRMELRPGIAASPICDGARLCRSLEQVFLQAAGTRG